MIQKRPAIFLDRDGTLIEDLHYLSDPAQVVLLAGCVDGLLKLSSAGFYLVVVTNQSGIARGLMTQGQVDEVNDSLADLLSRQGVVLDGIYLCPHGPDDGCRCRKPRAGMVEQAREKLPIDLTRSWVIGDKCSDVLLGQNVGVRTILLKTDETNSGQSSGDCQATATAGGFSEAVAYVTSHLKLS